MPIENWLELEGGVTGLFASKSTEWDTGLILKCLGRSPGIPSSSRPWVPNGSIRAPKGASSNAIASEAVLDFMFWPAKRHKFGWYFEPGCDYSFGHGHEQSLGVTGGLLIAIP